MFFTGSAPGLFYSPVATHKKQSLYFLIYDIVIFNFSTKVNDCNTSPIFHVIVVEGI